MQPQSSLPSLDGVVALVSPSPRGIGAAVGERLLAAGASVAVADVDGEAAAALAGELGAFPVECDVADEGSVRAAVDRVTQELGVVTALHNCAGISLHGRGDGPVDQAT